MKTLIKCDRCGKITVSVSIVPPPEPEPEIVSMDEYIKSNKSRKLYDYMSSDTRFIGTSYMEVAKLKCNDCGFERIWDRVVYT